MNTEINFLEKQPNKYKFPLFLGIVFLLLVACAVGVLLLQKSNYADQIETLQAKQSQMETVMQEHQNESADKRELQTLQQDAASIQADMVPHVALYNEVLGLLSTPDQLRDYDFTEENQLFIEAAFATLKDVAAYVAALGEETYILNVDISSVSNKEPEYQGTFTIDIDGEELLKELGKHE